jgi:hypothetical protein
MSGYYDFGVNEPKEKKFTDPVDLCLANNFFNLKDNPLVQGDATLCNDYMVQRCAAKWDDKCKLFLDQYIDPTFMLEVAKYKYCGLDPNSNCWQVCKPMNPLAQYSPTVCKVYGNQFYAKNSELYDVAGNFSLTSELRTTSPLTFTKCPVLCQGVDKIEKDDPVIDECFKTGKCQEVLQNLAIYASEKNIPVENAKFKDFMNNYIMNRLVPDTFESSNTAKTSFAMDDKQVSALSSNNSSNYKNFVNMMLDQKEPLITNVEVPPATFSKPKSGYADPTSAPSNEAGSKDVIVVTNCGDINKMHWIIILGIFVIITLILVHMYNKKNM